MNRSLLPNLALVFVALAAREARAADYMGICEASAGAYIGPNHFVVASDETNQLRIYQRGTPDPIGGAVDMEDFTSFDKSDLEAAARIGDRVYWISSHSFNRQGEDIEKRKVFFATRISVVNGQPTLTAVGSPVKTLRDGIAKAAGVKPSELNVEGLAATPGGGLLVGLRAPLQVQGGEALVVPFHNPGAVVDAGAQPDFGKVMKLDLAGSGIRSLDLTGEAERPYIVVAGPVSDAADGFALYRWSGKDGDKPVKVEGTNFAGLKPEGAMTVPDQQLIQLLSDDDNLCSDEDDPPKKRKFRSIDVQK
jgi:Protein of unknown function (DUF3616)